MHMNEENSESIQESMLDNNAEIVKNHEIEKLSAAINQLPIPIGILDNEGKVFSVNNAVKTLLMLQEEIQRGSPIEALQLGPYQHLIEIQLENSNEQTTKTPQEIWLRVGEDNLPLRFYLHFFMGDAKNNHYALIIFEDNRHKFNAVDSAKQPYFLDTLTELPTPFLFRHWLEQILLTRSDDKPLFVMCLHLDSCQTNESVFTKKTADNAIRQVAVILKYALEKKGLAARFDYDTFFIALHHVNSLIEANQWVYKLDQDLSYIAKSMSREIINFNIGIAVQGIDSNQSDALIDIAKKATYKDRMTHSHYRYACEETHQTMRARLSLEAQLREAVCTNKLNMLYQPRVDLVTGRVVGAEALLRWPTQEGIRRPYEFMPVAEKAGVMQDIDRLVIFNVSQQIHDWLDKGFDIQRVSLNVSSEAFKDETTLLHLFDDISKDIEIPLEHLEFEITENMVINNLEATIRTLENLQKNQVYFSIDDFGAGLSSLSLLMKLPVNVVKIDPCFVNDCHENPRSKALIQAIVDLSKTLNFQTIAEGVESVEQLQVLRQIGCDEYQGYYFSRPVNPKKLETDFLFRATKKNLVGRSVSPIKT
ncbi:MAG: GGDEF domain-containing phosphodiesterase [Pseudomonadota bacterium]